MQVAGRPMVLSEYRAHVPTITYDAPATTVASAVPPPTVTGTLVESEPAAPLAIAPPPPQVRDYVIANPAPPVYLNGEVVIGAGLPQTVGLTRVPEYDYDNAYVNQVPVLAQPSTRRIVYIYR